MDYCGNCGNRLSTSSDVCLFCLNKESEPWEHKLTTPVKELSDEHWQWVDGLLNRIFIDNSKEWENWRGFTEYLYKTAMEHGFKHGMESRFSSYEQSPGPCFRPADTTLSRQGG